MARGKDDGFAVAVNDCEDAVVSVRCREVCNEVHGHGFPDSFGDLVGLDRYFNRGPYLCGLACSASFDVKVQWP